MSEKAKVYFGSIQQGQMARFASFAAKVDIITEKLIEEIKIEKKDKVAIKMHLGFRDGYQTIPVFFVRRIVERIKKTGAYPFITDNPTSVYNAVNRGYTEYTCGCPIIPISGVKDGYVKEKKIDFLNVDSLSMAGALEDADVLVDLSHVKGHGACGFGGAIKNLALGGYSGPTRWKKIHGVNYAYDMYDPDKLTPELAKKLVAECPYHALSYNEEKHKLRRNYHDCHQCMRCLEIDQGLGAVKLPREAYSAFQEMMAIAANEVLKSFDKEKVFFMNFLLDITTYCDCLGMGQPPIVNDIGVLGSTDIIAIETASLDLIKKEGLIEKNIPPYIKHIDLTTPDLHPFTRVHGPYKDPYEVVQVGEKMNMGTSAYELIEILSASETMEMETPKRTFEDEPTFF
ncbi:MAG: DUF362 domain-containing protein [Candidatus Heimdallarchaeum aukensis]|uniref:DUF362 domain-containing protein n=1 Tax=Candidatus Heimdallarchaeum aukensis TaxID=2876573 RepID=A0A9Y1BJE3_9ARCH|nr:MAG: DUF362 domain-containing protein [Candidatus Heimdallarchaeum aukensis]